MHAFKNLRACTPINLCNLRHGSSGYIYISEVTTLDHVLSRPLCALSHGRDACGLDRGWLVPFASFHHNGAASVNEALALLLGAGQGRPSLHVVPDALHGPNQRPSPVQRIM